MATNRRGKVRNMRAGDKQTGVLSKLASKSLGFRLVLLAVVMLAAAVLVVLVGVLLFQTGLKTALIALIACLFSTLLAHVAGEYPQGDELLMARMAVQIVARTALPFGVAVWGIYFVDPPFEKSLVFYMILFYLVGLTADVQLGLAKLKAAGSE